MSKKKKGNIAKAMLPNQERDILLDILGEISTAIKGINRELTNMERLIDQIVNKYD